METWPIQLLRQYRAHTVAVLCTGDPLGSPVACLQPVLLVMSVRGGFSSSSEDSSEDVPDSESMAIGLVMHTPTPAGAMVVTRAFAFRVCCTDWHRYLSADYGLLRTDSATQGHSRDRRR
jgi:hypothetical protein